MAETHVLYNQIMMKKIKLIEDQEKLVTQLLSAKLDMFRRNNQQNLETSHRDIHCVCRNFYMLDCLSKLLVDLSLKLQDDNSFGCSSVLEDTVVGNQETLFLTKEGHNPTDSLISGSEKPKNNLPPSSSYGVNLMLPHIHQCLADVNKIKLTQASIQTDLDTYNQRSHDLERKVFDLQHQVDQLNEERTYLRDQLKQVALKHTALKKNVKKRHQQEEQTLKLLTKKVSTLVILKNILNEYRSGETSRTTQGVRKMCKESMDKLIKIEAELKTLDKTVTVITRSNVGFTAQLQSDRIVDSNQELKTMFRVISNVGNRFNPSSGSFVAPHDGLYGFCVKLEQLTNTNFTVFFITKTGATKTVKEMAVSFSKSAPHSAFCVLDLAKDAHVLLKIELDGERVELKSSLTFSGWSIGYD